MAYVPGFTNDVFISYSHGDNVSPFPDQRGWITFFGDWLTGSLPQLLGAPVKVWRDKKLCGDQPLDQTLRNQVESSAVFLAVVFPLYLNSAYCAAERECFLDKAGDTLYVGSRMRGIRVVKTPHEDRLHREIFNEQAGFEFFKETEHGSEDFAVESQLFQDSFRKVCQRIKGLLQQMRRNRVAVYVAECPSGLEGAENGIREERKRLQDDRKKVVTELTDHGYRVLPEIRIDQSMLNTVGRTWLEEAQVSVHLLGTEGDPLAIAQARLAMGQKKTLVTWTTKHQLYHEETDYGEFLRELMRYQDPYSRSQFLEGQSLEKLKTEILELLKPRSAEPTPRAADGRRVYVLCDGHEDADFKRAYQIGRLIEENDRFHVDLPQTGPLDPGEIRSDHKRKLRACDGLLLYWGQASETWFETTKVDLARRPLTSGAVALGDPGRGLVTVPKTPVIPLYGDFSYQTLDPFLQPLRQ